MSKMGLNMVGAAVVVADASDGTEPENPYGGEEEEGDNEGVQIRDDQKVTCLLQMTTAPWRRIPHSRTKEGRRGIY